MRVSEFDYNLPKEMIAQYPPDERAASRLLVLDRATGAIGHHLFADLPLYLREDDVLVINDSKVFPARLLARKVSGGRLEVLLVKPLGGGSWECLVRGIKKGVCDLPLVIGDFPVRLARDNGSWVIEFNSEEDADEALRKYGKMPLPPYIKRNGGDEEVDIDRYQTVYAAKTGSIAAPTAGFHFSEDLLERIRAKGVTIVTVTLHVGIGTFSLIRKDKIEEHKMESESYELDEASRSIIERAKSAGCRIVACGTSVVRTLETVFSSTGYGHNRGEAGLFIYPGYRFEVVDALITNFHLPRSTPLMLAAAFAGKEALLGAYQKAVGEGYRFYSYGDAMFII